MYMTYNNDRIISSCKLVYLLPLIGTFRKLLAQCKASFPCRVLADVPLIKMLCPYMTVNKAVFFSNAKTSPDLVTVSWQ